jgi:beta-1,4-N-acetylglucosaminyltransferase
MPLLTTNTTLLAVLATIALLTLQLVTLRLLSLSPHRRPPPQPRKRNNASSPPPTHLLIVLGSGGHTAEMIAMLKRSNVCASFGQRTWVVSSGDAFSAILAREFEDELCARTSDGGDGGGGGAKERWRVVQVTRARKVHQSLLSAPWSCLLCLVDCVRLLRPSVASSSRPPQQEQQGQDHEQDKEEEDTETEFGYPDLILANGPATATILIFASILLRFLGLKGNTAGKEGLVGGGEMRTIYVESWARVKKLSLSGTLLSWVVDRILVQWEQLHGAGPGGRAEFRGVLV